MALPIDDSIVQGRDDRIAADAISSTPGIDGGTVIKHERVKVEWGADGSVADVSQANPLPTSYPRLTGVEFLLQSLLAEQRLTNMLLVQGMNMNILDSELEDMRSATLAATLDQMSL
jgi:hypothetical protein